VQARLGADEGGWGHFCVLGGQNHEIMHFLMFLSDFENLSFLGHFWSKVVFWAPFGVLEGPIGVPTGLSGYPKCSKAHCSHCDARSAHFGRVP